MAHGACADCRYWNWDREYQHAWCGRDVLNVRWIDEFCWCSWYEPRGKED